MTYSQIIHKHLKRIKSQYASGTLDKRTYEDSRDTAMRRLKDYERVVKYCKDIKH